MATIKSYTNIEQSKKLAEILPLESADMFLAMNGTLPVMSKYIDNGLVTADETAIPCWSLAALLSVLPAECECMSLAQINYGNNHKEYFMSYTEGENTEDYDNPIDACYEMIMYLHKLNLL